MNGAVSSTSWERFAAGLDLLFERNPFYREKWASSRLTRASIQSPDDLSLLPFTTKEELLHDQQLNAPYGSNLSYSLQQYTRLHQTSGSSGRRLRWLDTPASWQWILDCWQVIFAASGVTAESRLFFPFSFGPFLGFWAAFEAAQRLPAFVLAGGGLSTRARLQLLRDNACDVVCCTPTYALRLVEVARDDGIDLASAGVKTLILAGEPGANVPATRRLLEEAWRARIIDHCGMTEVGSFGVEYVDWPGHLTLLADEVIAEFVSPQGDAYVAEGEMGELVITNLGRWGSPLVRYRTGDLVVWRRKGTGNTPVVYLEGGILTRVDDMVWIRGNNVYPSAVEAVVRRFTEIDEFEMIATGEPGRMDLLIRVEPRPSGAVNAASLATAVETAIHDRLYFRPSVEAVAPGTLTRYDMKSRRFIRRP